MPANLLARCLAGCVVALVLCPVLTFAAPGDLLLTIQDPTQTQGAGGFGGDIAAAGNRVVVGAYCANNWAGAAYLFDTTSGSLLQTFQNPGVLTGENNFGCSVAIVGNSVVVGDQQANYGVGAAYVFDATSASLLHTLLDPRGGTSYAYYFGRYVAPSGNNVLVNSHPVVRCPSSTRRADR